ncbi:hypothetical protein C3V43_10495 [Bacteroides heparinolyticus]|uniref:DUF4249 family protein n=1 Tax=Prevotella heparinolytica TaxID=28113 RepID=UPI000D033624|nr:DUF4249 family protein [Bacteroides heparinolyticus]AVM58132.1 hypothetical protein C3V43_10495 [Bacteroides heparinolyticus]
MMNLKKIVVGCAGLLLLAGCERVLHFEDGGTRLRGLVVNAIAATDTLFAVSVSQAYLFKEVPALLYFDYWRYSMCPDSFYYDKAVRSDAEVELTVNGQERYILRYDEIHRNYVSDYTPRSGDRLELCVRAGEEEEAEEVTAETVVPASRKLEVLGCEKFYDKNWYSSSGELMDFSTDTVARITLRLTDPKGGDYYRLKVRSSSNPAPNDSWPVWRYSDIYTSGDIIFMDQQLEKAFGGWPAHFSNVFDDHLFDGKEYTFTVETRLRWGESPHAVIELQSITRDLYYYLKSAMLYRITDEDSYTESILIHSNVNNGWGILGGLGTQKQIVWF